MSSPAAIAHLDTLMIEKAAAAKAAVKAEHAAKRAAPGAQPKPTVKPRLAPAPAAGPKQPSSLADLRRAAVERKQAERHDHV